MDNILTGQSQGLSSLQKDRLNITEKYREEGTQKNAAQFPLLLFDSANRQR